MLLFCAKTIVKESHNFEKKKERKAFWSSGNFSDSVLLQRIFMLLGMLYVMKHSKMNGALS